MPARLDVTSAHVKGSRGGREHGSETTEAVRARVRVFDPFYTTKPTGLGLSLAHDIVTQGHGGALAVGSAPGAGATFTVRLPAAP